MDISEPLSRLKMKELSASELLDSVLAKFSFFTMSAIWRGQAWFACQIRIHRSSIRNDTLSRCVESAIITAQLAGYILFCTMNSCISSLQGRKFFYLKRTDTSSIYEGVFFVCE